MIIILLGKPLVFWFGILALLSFSLQIYLGIKMTKGHPELLKYHRLNALILSFIVVVHLVLGLRLYLPNRANSNLETNNAKAPNITIRNFSFNPLELIIKKGNTVTWTNQDSTPHIISGNGFQSDTLNKGQSFTFIFNNVGTFDYICSIHPFMKGKIIVQ